MKILHADADRATLELVRRAVVVVAILVTATQPVTDLAALPVEAFTPVGPLRLLPEAWWSPLLSWPVLTGLWLSCFSALAASLLLQSCGREGRYPVTVTLLAGGLFTLLLALPRGFTRVHHAELALAVLLLALPLFALADRLRHRQGNTAKPGLTLVPLVLMFQMTYLLTASRRLFNLGWELFNPEHTWAWCVQHLHETPPLWGLDAPWMEAQPALLGLLSIGLPVVTLMEFLAPVALVWPAFRRMYLVVMLAFHAGAVFFFHLYFIENMLLMVLLLVDWTALRQRYSRR